MQEIKVSHNKQDHSILFFTTSEELPIKRYTKFQKYLLIESGVGSTINEIGTHFSKVFDYLVHKLTDQALQETKNLYYNFYLLLNEINIPSFAFCCLIHSIDGVQLTDLTEDNLKKVIDHLNEIGVTQSEVIDKIEVVKKNSVLN